MKIKELRERGTISDQTEIVNDGDYVAYAQVRYGPYAVMFYRGRERTHYLPRREERYKVSGPLVGGSDSDGAVMFPASETVVDTVTHAIDSWDYVELAEREVFDNA